jgi:adenine-specific DNA-methyltransferase
VGSKYEHLNREELIRLLETRDRRARFGLVWEADEIERDQALNSDFVALDLVPELSCPQDAAAWRNLIIEGDNFDALRHLRMAFAGQVKCIYIDPPYNTGNRDFVYNDRFVDKEDSWRHSKWCEFMFQRLMLARDLLAPDGVIVVSIDDNEIFSLGLLMNRVFGETNFLANVVWQHSVQPKGYSGKVSVHHNFLLTYGSSPLSVLKDIPRTEAHNVNYSNPDNDPNGPWRAGDVRNALYRPNLIYDLTTPSGKIIKPPAKGWRWSKETMAEKIRTGEIVFRDDDTRIVRKIYLGNQEGRPVESIWFGDDVGTTREGNKEIKAVFDGQAGFDTPKPVRLIERVLQICCGPNDLVLDFFAGSGTTAHAVHKLNAEDGGRRRVILVSSTEATQDAPEKNLCRDVCATRVRRIIEGYTPAGGEPVPGLGGDFTYLRTRRIPAGRVLEIDHAQVWTALQLMHRDTLTSFEEGKFCWAGDEDEAVMYLPRFRREDAPLLLKQVKRSAAVALYSWQPRTVAQHLRAAHVTHLAIPETLARRFGLGQGGKA